MRTALLPSIIVFAIAVIYTSAASAQNGLNFDAVDDEITVPGYKGVLGTTARTVEAWVRIPVGSNNAAIVDWGTNTPGNRWNFRAQGNGVIRVEVEQGYYVGSTNILDGQWHHVACVWANDGTPDVADTKLYVDGQLEVPSQVVNRAINTIQDIDMLVGNDRFARFFSGDMDELRIWNVARTQAQIQANMNNEVCAPRPGLVVNYRFNQGNAGSNNLGLNSLVDVSGGAHTGTLLSFALNGPASNWVVGRTLVPGVASASAFTAQSCDSYTVPSGDETYTTGGVVMDTIPNTAGCDSVMTITVTIGESTTAALTESSCVSYTAPSGAVLTSTGIYTDVIPNAAGCDSTITLDITILPVDVTVTFSNGTLSANATSATYQWLDCNAAFAAIPGADQQQFTPGSTGSYAVAITQGACTDTSTCLFLQVMSILENDLSDRITLFPNPTAQACTVLFDVVAEDLSVELYDATGRRVFEQSARNTDRVVIDRTLAPGMYRVLLRTTQGQALIPLVVR